MPTNNLERSGPRIRENSQTLSYNSYPKITSLAKSPSTHPPQDSISYLQHSSNLLTLLHSLTSHHPNTRVYSPTIISFLVSPSSLILSEVLQPLLCLRCTSSNGLPKETSVNLLIILTHLSISLILRLHSPLLHSTHD